MSENENDLPEIKTMVKELKDLGLKELSADEHYESTMEYRRHMAYLEQKRLSKRF